MRQRLVRRGVLAPAAALGWLLEEKALAVPPALMAAAQRLAGLVAIGEAAALNTPVATLAKAALPSAAVCRLKWMVTLALVFGALAAGAGWAAHQVLAVKPVLRVREDESQPATRRTETPQDADPRPVRVDYYGDPLPTGTLVRLGTTRLRHPAAQIAFSDDGKTLISASGDHKVRFWDLATSNEVQHTQLQLPPAKRLLGAAALAPGGKLFAAIWDDANYIHEMAEVYVHETRTGRQLKRFPVGRFARSHLVFSPDGEIVATIDSPPQDGVLRLWDVATGTQRMRMNAKGFIGSFTFSCDGKSLAALTWGNGTDRLCVWDTISGPKLRQVPAEVGSVGFSPDGQTVATANRSGTVTLGQATTLTRVATLKPKDAAWTCDCLACSPDGKLLAVGCDKEVVLWDVEARQQRFRLPQRKARQLVFAPDSKTLACAGEFELQLWDTSTGARLHDRPGHDGNVGSIAVSPDGKVIASAAWYNPMVHLWDAATGKPLAPCGAAGDWVRSCDFSADGRQVMAANRMVQLLEPRTGKELCRFVGPQRMEVLAAHLSDDGRRLAAVCVICGTQQYQLNVWDAGTGMHLLTRPLRMSLDNCLDSCFTPDGESVAMRSRDYLAIEDTMTGQPQVTIPGDLGAPVAFTPDGQLVAVGVHKTDPLPDHSWQPLGVRVFEVATGQKVFQVDGWIERAVFSPDGRLLATADPETLRIWDALTGTLRFRRPWPRDLPSGPVQTPIGSLAWFPDHSAVVTGLADGTSLVWDVEPRTWPAVGVTRRLSRKDLEALWSDLAGNDVACAHRAIHTLAAAPPGPTVAFLAEHLRPAPQPDPAVVQRLLADLDRDDFKTRATAARQLAELGEKIEPALKQVLQGKTSPELRRRVAALLDAHRVPSAETVRTLRALRVLERMGTRQARQLLQQLATSAAATLETRQAQAALKRLNRRPASAP